MESDDKAITSGMVIITEMPRTRFNNWISNLNTIASVMGVSTIGGETRDFVYADKTNEVIDLTHNLCNESGSIEKQVGEEGETETRLVDWIPMSNVKKDDVIYASLFNNIRLNYNNLVEWYNWYTG